MESTAQLVPTHTGQELPPGLIDLPQTELLLGYQGRAMISCDHNSLMVFEKSRRIGLTWGIASYAVLRASAQPGEAGGSDFLYISYSQEMTREFIDACAMWAKALLPAAAEVGEFLFDDQDEEGNTKQIKAFRISFASGFEIVALSSAPRSIRGKQGIVCIDEAAFVDHLAELLKAAMALLMWGGQVIVISTHDGVDNPFNQLLDDIKAGKREGGHMKITLADALADGLYERICLVTSKTPTPEGKIAWEAKVRGTYGEDADEELDCKPKAGAGSFIPPDLVIAAEHEDAGKPELYAGGACFGGRDIAAGRGGDSAELLVAEQISNVLWLRDHQQGRKIGLLDQEKMFEQQMQDFRILRYGFDQTGMGEGEVARAQKKFGSAIIGIIFGPATRLAMATALLRCLEEGRLRLPRDPAIRADMRAIKKVKGAGDTVRLVNEGDVHADFFWALALLCLVAESDVLVYFGYEAAPPAPGKFDERAEYGIAGSFHMRAEDDEALPRVGTGTF